MKIHVHKRSGKYLCSLDVPDDATADDLKNLFCSTHHYYPERQRFTIGSVKGAPVQDGLLADQHIVDGATLCFKDLGVQISWRLVFVLEYLGPLVIMPLFWFFPRFIYPDFSGSPVHRSRTQMIAVLLFLGHFLKREFETLFVHRFSNATMPVIRLPINCAHYWLLCATGIGYFLCHPKYQAPFSDNHVYVYALAVLFLLFEALNFKTHLILRGLRPRGTKERGIPQGCGFQWTSCANYTWEVAAWIVFSCLTMTFSSFVFTVVAFYQMLIWALKKHAAYKKTFPHYPRTRRSIIPFII